MLRTALWFTLDTTQHLVDGLQLVVDLGTIALAAGEQ